MYACAILDNVTTCTVDVIVRDVYVARNFFIAEYVYVIAGFLLLIAIIAFVLKAKHF